MKRTVIALTVTALAAAGAGVASAQPGNGAQKSGLVSASSPLAPTCTAADATAAGQQTPHGFVVLNAPGRPAKSGKNAREDGTRKLLGQVALRGAAADTTYEVLLNCTDKVGTLKTDARGDGSYRFSDSTRGAGTYFLALRSTPVAGVPVAEQLLLQDRFVSSAVQVR